MDQKETKRFDKLYQRHLQMLKLQGKSEKTREAYARAIRRLRDHFDCCPDKLTPKQPVIIQHVLSKGFRRVRDYGFLHGNAKKAPIAGPAGFVCGHSGN